MAKEKTKKGFFFWFGLFLLIIVGAVLVIFVVMLFLPGTSIMGLEYFSNNKGILVSKTTDESGTLINFGTPNFSSIVINASYSRVTIQKNYEYEKSGVYIINNSKGFVTSKNAKPFEYSVTIKDGALTIDVKEQPGFLYFSKDCEIVVHLVNDEGYNPLANMPIKVVNTDGYVNIGGNTLEGGNSGQVSVGNLDISNGSGGILVSSLAPKYYQNLTLKTTSGDIKFGNGDITATNMHLETGSGTIEATTLTSTNPINIVSEKGIVRVRKFQGKLFANVKDAYMDISTVTNGVDFSNSPFSSSVVKIGEITNGGLTARNAKATKFDIGSVNGEVKVGTTTGDIILGGQVSSNSELSTSSGQIKAQIHTNATNVSVLSEKGKIDLTVPSNFSGLTVSNMAGSTNLTLERNGAYTFKFVQYDQAVTDENLAKFNPANVHLNRTDVTFANPLKIQNGSDSKIMILKCNKDINFNWV